MGAGAATCTRRGLLSWRENAETLPPARRSHQPGPFSMTQTAAFTLEQMTAEVLRGIIETVGERADDTPARKSLRHATTVFSVMAFLPRDAIELMLAGQCVIFDHVLRDGARDLLRDQDEKVKARVRPQLVSTGNSFLKHLTAPPSFRNGPSTKSPPFRTPRNRRPPKRRNRRPSRALRPPTSRSLPRCCQASRR